MKTLILIALTSFAGTIVWGQTTTADDNAKATTAAAVATPAESVPPATKIESVANTDATPAEATSTKDAGAPSQSSIEYVGADIQDVLRTLARQAGLNLVMSEEIIGKVTISLVDVPFEKAIQLICDSKGYAVTKEENILKVQTRASLAAEPLQEEIVSLSYMTTVEAEKVLKPFLTQGRGSVTSDTRSNTLVLSDVPSKLKQMQEIIARIDTQTPQVMIEVRVIETAKTPKQDYGIKWDSLRNYEVAAKNIGYGFNSTSGGFGLSRYKGAASPVNEAGGIKDAEVSVLTASDFRLLISFLNSNGETELLASPRIVTADNKEAKIAIAQQFPIAQFAFNQQTASLEVSGFEFKDIGILLTVTPHINKSGYVTLELKPEVSTFDPNRVQSFGGAVQAQIPIIDTRKLQASVLIKDGHTLALGGLIREDSLRSFTKVPIMGDIPGLGGAFRHKSFEKTKRNLIIFITPTIVSPDGTTGPLDMSTGAKPEVNDDFANPTGWKDNAFPKSEQKARAKDPSSF